MRGSQNYVYRSEETRTQAGDLQLIVWRRRLLSAIGDRVELGAVERAVVGTGADPEWKPTGGLLGRACTINRERFDACGYSTKPPKEAEQCPKR